MVAAGIEITSPSVMDISTSKMVESDSKLIPDILRPDALLGSAWFLESSRAINNSTNMNNATAMPLGDDCCSERRPMPAETEPLAGGLGLDSYPWNNMPSVCQMFELP